MKKFIEKRAWGGFERFTLNENSTVKILTIKPGKEFSLQYHEKRIEFWQFLDNPAIVTIGNRKIKAKKGTELYISKKTLHRIKAINKPVKVLEISFGKFSENDIVRIEDDYGRVKL